MALIIPSGGISSLAGRETPASITPSVRRRNVRFSVCSGVKDLQKEVLKLRGDNSYEDNVWWLYGQVKQSGPAPFPSSKTEDDEGKKQDYYVNTGYAIRSLREEFPELFYRELSFDIYSDPSADGSLTGRCTVYLVCAATSDSVAHENAVCMYCRMLSCNLKVFFFFALPSFWMGRLLQRLFFSSVECMRIAKRWMILSSKIHSTPFLPVENMIMVRWTVHGIPRIPWERRSRFDGTSEYKLDKDGKIYEHKVHNIALNGPQKFQVLAVEQLIQSIGCPSTPKPTYFEFSSSSMTDIGPLVKLSAVKHYLVSVLTRRLHSEAES
ncbi:hypothetical protein Sango_0218800 [Sesamum angolense]|uniref:Uncharacterized protein n=1 Tax=Sesamum angolense TaxID=2727404 RepID=A0AAE1XGN2_9LAMI|nr:hypothetical protein Sango_0218800 [Sesamum angolense]